MNPELAAWLNYFLAVIGWVGFGFSYAKWAEANEGWRKALLGWRHTLDEWKKATDTLGKGRDNNE